MGQFRPIQLPAPGSTSRRWTAAREFWHYKTSAWPAPETLAPVSTLSWLSQHSHKWWRGDRRRQPEEMATRPKGPSAVPLLRLYVTCQSHPFSPTAFERVLPREALGSVVVRVRWSADRWQGGVLPKWSCSHPLLYAYSFHLLRIWASWTQGSPMAVGGLRVCRRQVVW
jgi:hypothetical protein